MSDEGGLVSITPNSKVSIGLILTVVGVIVGPPIAAYWSMDQAVDEMRIEVRSGFSQLTTEVKHLRELQSRFTDRLRSYDQLNTQVTRLESELGGLVERVKQLEKNHD